MIPRKTYQGVARIDRTGRNTDEKGCRADDIKLAEAVLDEKPALPAGVRAEVRRSSRSRRGVNVGSICSNKAMAPATWGAACDVPRSRP